MIFHNNESVNASIKNLMVIMLQGFEFRKTNIKDRRYPELQYNIFMTIWFAAVASLMAIIKSSMTKQKCKMITISIPQEKMAVLIHKTANAGVSQVKKYNLPVLCSIFIFQHGK